jgi:hypothetical protein
MTETAPSDWKRRPIIGRIVYLPLATKTSVRVRTMIVIAVVGLTPHGWDSRTRWRR